MEVTKVKDNIDQIERENKSHLATTLVLKQKTHDNDVDLRGLKKVVEKYSLKLNITNGFGGLKSGSAWSLHSDTDAYPILKSDDRNYHYTKFQDNIKTTKLKGSKLTNIRDFWRNISITYMSTLQSNT